MTYELHPLCTLFPRMQGAEFDALVADLKANGQREPIILHDDLILDGGNRYRACLAAGIEPQFMRFGGGNLVAYVLSANLHRRHMTPGQQAAIVASAQDWAKAHVHGGDRKTDQVASLPLETIADRAAISGAGERTQRMADKVAKASPELAKQVANGEKTLPQAVEELTGKRPGAKPKKQEASAEYDPGDPSQRVKELAHALAESATEVNALTSLVKSLEANDGAAEIAKLHERILGLEGRLAQETTSKNEAIRSAKYYKGILDKIAKKVGVTKYGEIIGALK
ncbi:MAG: hypothetical protein ACRCV5_19045 [Afipia sp.]